MHILSRLRLRTKLALLMGLSALALVVSIGFAASIMHQRMIDDRVDKLRAVVQTTVGLAQSLENQVAAHQLTREQALEQFRTAAHVMRFDAGAGYIYAQTLDNMFVDAWCRSQARGHDIPGQGRERQIAHRASSSRPAGTPTTASSPTPSSGQDRRSCSRRSPTWLGLLAMEPGVRRRRLHRRPGRCIPCDAVEAGRRSAA